MEEIFVTYQVVNKHTPPSPNSLRPTQILHAMQINVMKI